MSKERTTNKTLLYGAPEGAALDSFLGAVGTGILGIVGGALHGAGITIPASLDKLLLGAAPIATGMYVATEDYLFENQKQRLRTGRNIAAATAITEGMGYAVGYGITQMFSNQ